MNKWSHLIFGALGLSATLYSTAHAGLAAVDMGPYTLASGRYPLWYEDNTGKKLELCQSKALSPTSTPAAPAYMCILIPEPGIFDDLQPMVFPDNWPPELFWYLAEATIAPLAGNPNYELEAYVAGIEAAFASENPVDGDQQSFARIRMRINIPIAGAYTITHPYGQETINVTAPGRRAINITRDIGIGAPGDFTGALSGAVGPFLHRVGDSLLATNPETGETEEFIGDPNVLEPVTGSPNGTNYIRITGPAGELYTELFSLSGKVYDDRQHTPVEISRSTYRRNGNGTWLEVFANSTPDSTLCYRETLDLIQGTPPSPCLVNLFANSNGQHYIRQAPTSGVPPFLVVTARSGVGTTKPTSTSARVVDVVKVSDATYSWSDHTLRIGAASSDEVSIPDLVAQGYGRLSKTGINQTLEITDLAQPPAFVTVKSSAGGSDREPVTVIGQAPEPAENVPPVGVADTATTTAGTPVSIDVLANDTDAEEGTLRIVDLIQPEAGQGSVAVSNGSVLYTPPSDVAAQLSATFSYRAEDSGGLKSEPATVTVTVDPAPVLPPVALGDVLNFTVNGNALLIPVLANDSNPAGGALTVVALTQPAQGITTTDGTQVTYTPPASVTAPLTVSFTYRVQNAQGVLSAPATVTINLAPRPNQPPVAGNDSGSLTATAGSTLLISVLDNDSDPENGALTVTALTPPSSGSVTTDGTRVTYTPPANVTATTNVTFTYRAQDSLGAQSAPATVTVTVTPPPAVQETLTVTSSEYVLRTGNRYTWDIAGTSSQTAGNTITIRISTANGSAVLGTVAVAASGRWRLAQTTTTPVPTANPTATLTSSFGTVQTVSVVPR